MSSAPKASRKHLIWLHLPSNAILCEWTWRHVSAQNSHFWLWTHILILLKCCWNLIHMSQLGDLCLFSCQREKVSSFLENVMHINQHWHCTMQQMSWLCFSQLIVTISATHCSWIAKLCLSSVSGREAPLTDGQFLQPRKSTQFHWKCKWSAGSIPRHFMFWHHGEMPLELVCGHWLPDWPLGVWFMFVGSFEFAGVCVVRIAPAAPSSGPIAAESTVRSFDSVSCWTVWGLIPGFDWFTHGFQPSIDLSEKGMTDDRFSQCKSTRFHLKSKWSAGSIQATHFMFCHHHFHDAFVRLAQSKIITWFPDAHSQDAILISAWKSILELIRWKWSWLRALRSSPYQSLIRTKSCWVKRQ